MALDNPVIPSNEIPHIQEVPLQPVESAYKKVLFITWTIIYVLIAATMITLTILIDELQKPWVIALNAAILLLIIAFSLGSIIVGFKNRSWGIREKDILFKKGWLFQSTHIIPFIKVQHCIVKCGPIDRRFGLASIKVMTAASHDLDISIHGLKQETAEDLKILIMEKIERYASQGI